MIRTVIFDMDGVIVDTEPLHKFAYYAHFDELGIVVSDEMYATFTGNSTRNVFQKLKSTFAIEAEVEDLIQRKRTIFNDAFDTSEILCLLPGVKDLIVDLNQNDMQLILASSASKGTIARVFNRFELTRYFSHIVSGEDFPKSKPDPAIFIHAARLSGDGFDECVVIEDSTNGVKAAKAAGLACIGYKSEHTKFQDISDADWIISSFDELNAGLIKNFKA
ncbi:MAG: HAD family hydrolase [Flavobacterium sp.]|nr:HAD family hydrolase [Flavobacterium sp.]